MESGTAVWMGGGEVYYLYRAVFLSSQDSCFRVFRMEGKGREGKGRGRGREDRTPLPRACSRVCRVRNRKGRFSLIRTIFENPAFWVEKITSILEDRKGLLRGTSLGLVTVVEDVRRNSNLSTTSWRTGNGHGEDLRTDFATLHFPSFRIHAFCRRRNFTFIYNKSLVRPPLSTLQAKGDSSTTRTVDTQNSKVVSCAKMKINLWRQIQALS